MNVFILSTGRTGSTTFVKACNHISNYTTGHETRVHYLATERLNYPQNHIESDNRLSWILGRLDKKFGDEAFYVHLIRDKEILAQSLKKRINHGILKAYNEGILANARFNDPQELAMDYISTVNANIHLFLKNKTNKISLDVNCYEQGFNKFWNLIGAQGNYEAALGEFLIQHNQSSINPSLLHKLNVVRHKIKRVITNLPKYYKEA